MTAELGGAHSAFHGIPARPPARTLRCPPDPHRPGEIRARPRPDIRHVVRRDRGCRRRADRPRPRPGTPAAGLAVRALLPRARRRHRRAGRGPRRPRRLPRPDDLPLGGGRPGSRHPAGRAARVDRRAHRPAGGRRPADTRRRRPADTRRRRRRAGCPARQRLRRAAAVRRDPNAALNLGGIANITVVAAGRDPVAFDPGRRTPCSTPWSRTRRAARAATTPTARARPRAPSTGACWRCCWPSRTTRRRRRRPPARELFNLAYLAAQPAPSDLDPGRRVRTADTYGAVGPL
jgi:hypothetical protein